MGGAATFRGMGYAALVLAACKGTEGPLVVRVGGGAGSVAGRSVTGPMGVGGLGGISGNGSGPSGTGSDRVAGSAGTPDADVASASAGAGGATPPRADTLTTDGRYLLDRCGHRLVLRGVEQNLREPFATDTDWLTLMDEIAGLGVNSVRLHVRTDSLAVSDVDGVLARLKTHGMIAIVSPERPTWLGDEAVRAMLLRHSGHLIVEAATDATYDDREQFVSDALEAIAVTRGYGYQEPLFVTSNNSGRDLPVLLEYGSQIVASDPMRNTVLGWQAYWGSSGRCQDLYAMSLGDGLRAVAEVDFPIQIGVTRITDWQPTEYLDYGAIMTAAQSEQIGWHWWDWYDPAAPDNNLSVDGSLSALTTIGQEIGATHVSSLATTSRLPCVAEP